MPLTAIELLKANAANLESLDLGPLLQQWCRDMNYPLPVIATMARTGAFGTFMNQLVLRQSPSLHADTLLNYFGGRLGRIPRAERSGIAKYSVGAKDNRRIMRALSFASSRDNGRRFVGEGMAASFEPQYTSPAPTFGSIGFQQYTQVAIIGNGPAGIMLRRALINHGWPSNMLVTYETRGKSKGIWTYPNVVNRSRNNPRHLRFYGVGLDAAPGAGGEVSTFLSELGITQQQRKVLGVRSNGPFKHRIEFGPENVQDFPIVVNCMGLGEPKSTLDHDAITTDSKDLGPRWQQELTRERVSGKMLVMVGLGNSTAEMLRQLHQFQDQGVECDYRILTHYPKDAIFNPDDRVEVDYEADEGHIRIFRDVSLPNLVDYQGDLAESRYDYHRALSTGKIIHDVFTWNRRGPSIIYKQRNNYYSASPSRLKADELFTLIGYQHTGDTFRQFGIRTDSRTQPLYSYDGEFVGTKGYFGMGAILDTAWNRNAVVIPGMIGMIGDLIFSIIVRSIEFQQLQERQLEKEERQHA